MIREAFHTLNFPDLKKLSCVTNKKINEFYLNPFPQPLALLLLFQSYPHKDDLVQFKTVFLCYLTPGDRSRVSSPLQLGQNNSHAEKVHIGLELLPGLGKCSGQT